MTWTDDIITRLKAGETVSFRDYKGRSGSGYRSAMSRARERLKAEGITVLKKNLPTVKGGGPQGRPFVAYSIAPSRPRASQSTSSPGGQRAEIQLRMEAGESVAPAEYAATVVIRAIRQLITEGHRLVRDVETRDGHVRSVYRKARKGEPILEVAQTYSSSRSPSPALDPAVLQETSRGHLRLMQRSEVEPAMAASSNGSSAPPAMPTVGSTLQVRGLQLERDGSLSVVLGDGSWLWAAALRGVTREPSNDD